VRKEKLQHKELEVGDENGLMKGKGNGEKKKPKKQ